MTEEKPTPSEITCITEDSNYLKHSSRGRREDHCSLTINNMAASSVFRPGLFNQKVAIVTGGGTGIGKAISAELLDLGE